MSRTTGNWQLNYTDTKLSIEPESHQIIHSSSLV